MKGFPVKVVHVFGSLNVGGAESRTMDVFRKVDRKRVMFYFVSLDESEKQFFENEITSLGGIIYKIPSPRKVGIIKHLSLLKDIFKDKNKNGKLIVHSHTLHHCGIVMLAARLAKVKIRISHARNTSSQNQGLKGRIMIGVGKILISFFATEMLAITNDAANFLYYNSDIKYGKVKIIPNAIELDRYKKIDNEKLLRLKREFDIKENFTVIGHVGRFERMKNHEFLIKLFSIYCKQQQSILILIGEGSLKKEMESLVDSLNLQNKVMFLGVRNDVYLWMNIFDLVIMPSLFEGLPGLASESQAAGTPCILSDNITKKTDLGLGLVSYISLQNNVYDWIDSINKSLHIKKPTFEQIEKKFEENNLSLDKEIKLLYEIYNV